MRLPTSPLLVALAGLAVACGPEPSPSANTDGASTSASSTGPDAPDDSGPTNDSEDSGPPQTCGNSIVDADEECDLGEDNGNGDYCRDDCRHNVCGDGYLAESELCDDGNTVDDDGCTNRCGPASCGDGTLQPPEQCDNGDDNSASGSCLPGCVVASCGDLSILEGVEICDGSNTGTASCIGEGFDSGTLSCSPDCSELETDGCFICGNGVREPANGEECDGIDLGGYTCADFVPKGASVWVGALSCTAGCQFNPGDCHFCGDGVQQGDEQCDGPDLALHDCLSQGFDGGQLECDTSCTFIVSQCTTCGDDEIEGDEQCEGADLNGATCADVGLPLGDPTCAADCLLNYDGCFE